MSRLGRRRRFIGLASVSAVMVAAGWYLVAVDLPASDDLSIPALLTGVAIVLLVPGLVAEWRRPRDPVAWLVVLVALATVAAAFRLLRPRWAATVGAAAFYALPLLGCDLVLRMPDGWHGRGRRRLVAWCWVAPTLVATGLMLVTGPRRTAADLHTGGLRAASWIFRFAPDGQRAQWFRQGNLLHVSGSDAAARALWAVWSSLVLVVAWTTVVAAARRCDATNPADRRTARLLRAAAIAVAAGVTVQPIAAVPEQARLLDGVPAGSVLQGHWYADLVNVAPALAAAALGTTLLWSELVRPRLGRRTNGTIDLDSIATPSTLGLQLERALGDPTARVLFPRDNGTWVDDAGRVTEPAALPGRAATVVTRDGVAVAAVEHDDWLLYQPDLVDVAVASVALTLEGRRLAALARAGADDVRASAVRLLDAAEVARRAVERRIEEGPERTLESVGALLRSEPVPLDEVHRGLRTAVAEVREIAHGIAPAGLVEDGLGVALDDLAATGEVSVTVTELPSAPLPPSIETTVYLVAQDAVRHADRPLRLAVSVSADHQANEVGVHVDGWTGPPDQLVDDRVRTLGGVIVPSGTGLRVALPLTAY